MNTNQADDTDVPHDYSNIKQNVYDRLSARGRDYAFKRLNWVPPNMPVQFKVLLVVFPLKSFMQYSFSPELNSKTREIANKKRSRSMSADRSSHISQIFSPSNGQYFNTPQNPQDDSVFNASKLQSDKKPNRSRSNSSVDRNHNNNRSISQSRSRSKSRYDEEL